MSGSRYRTLSLVLTCVCALTTRVSGQVAGEADAAQIRVHRGKVLHAISPLLFGVGIEWTENGNGLADDDGRLRPELVELLKPLRIPVVRFPGGILADFYHWRDGIGPQSQRPAIAEPQHGDVHRNTFGSDELVALSNELNADLLITANFGSGTLQEALDWQTYLQSRGKDAKYWEIGNELYLAQNTYPSWFPGLDSRVYKTSAEYADGFRQWSRALKSMRSEVFVGAIVGTWNTSDDHTDWIDVLIHAQSDPIDFIALHNSFAPAILVEYDYSNTQSREEAYKAMYAQPAVTAYDTSNVRTQFAQAGLAPNIAITEHGPLFGIGTTSESFGQVLDQSKTLGAAIFTAAELHTFMRQNTWMANFTLTNSRWFGALLTDGENGPVRTPFYHVFDLYRNHFGSTLLDVEVINNPTFANAELGIVPAVDNNPTLDVVASVDLPNGSTYLAVINRDLHQARAASIQVDSVAPGIPAEVNQISNASANAVNAYALSTTVVDASADPVRIVQSSWTNVTGSDRYTFPPNSVTVFRW